jgi:hypothetical protein
VKVEKLQYDLCYDEPRPSRRANIYAVTIILTFFTILMVVLRCWSRYTVSKQFWWDDWFVIFSTICFLGLQASNLWGVGMGFGVHVWNVNPSLNKKLYQVCFVKLCKLLADHNSTNGYMKFSTWSPQQQLRPPFSSFTIEFFLKHGYTKQSGGLVGGWAYIS